MSNITNLSYVCTICRGVDCIPVDSCIKRINFMLDVMNNFIRHKNLLRKGFSPSGKLKRSFFDSVIDMLIVSDVPSSVDIPSVLLDVPSVTFTLQYYISNNTVT